MINTLFLFVHHVPVVYICENQDLSKYGQNTCQELIVLMRGLYLFIYIYLMICCIVETHGAKHMKWGN